MSVSIFEITGYTFLTRNCKTSVLKAKMRELETHHHFFSASISDYFRELKLQDINLMIH